jgi:predicted ATPase/DNA-binding winged helix-turn-helix (wHTH) protein
VDLERRELRARGVPVPLGGRAFQIFAVLVQSAGQLVTKDELMARVWPGAIVEENKLQVHVSAVRKALGPDRGTLRTSFGRGYRVVGDWTIRKECTPADQVALAPTRMPVQPFLNNLPAAASGVIGRTAAVQQLQEFLSAYRTITLTGPGGIGKTTLALEVARSLFPAFNGDCWLVDLASLSDPALVPSTVAGVLGLGLGGDEISTESVARAIGGKKLLLVLDNCEHLIDATARLAETVVRLCPAISIVATSREVLRIEGEHVYRVPPLDVPSPHQEESDVVIGHSAVQLFIARARALDSDFSTHGENLRTIASICRRLDGIPLAIEFAAAHAAMLGPELVLSRLDERFGLLTGGRRTALPRHQTLRATLDWSYELLPEPERCLLRRLGVFAASFTLDAAIAVMSDQGHTASVILDEIANLAAKSLVTLDESAPTGRWRLFETTRAYALEKLAESGETEQIVRRCAEFFRDLVRPAMHGSQLLPTVEDYVARKNQGYTIWTRYDQRLMARAMLAPVLWLRGFVDQGVTQAQASLEEAHAADHKLTLCWVLYHATYPVALMTGDLVAAGQAVAMLMDLATSLRAPFWKTLAHCLEGKLLIRRGEFGMGSAQLRTALETCERTGWTISYPEFSCALAEGLAGLGQFTGALATIDRALARANRGGERWFVAELLRNKGELLLHEAGDHSISAAERCFSEALEVAREQDALSWELRSALSFARLRLRQDREDDARQLLAPVYSKFTEGFETPDLRSASAMLQSLPSRLVEFAR